VLPDGTRSYFRNQNVGVNPLGAAEVADDKEQTAYFLAVAGISTIEGAVFFDPHWAGRVGAPDRSIDCAYEYAQSLGLPVVVKPNSRSQGEGVAAAFSRREFLAALHRAALLDRVVLVQRYVQGRDYRLVVLDDDVISAYERIPLRVLGDGHQSVGDLLTSLRAQFVLEQRETTLDASDPRIGERLARSDLTLASVPSPGEVVYLLDNANLSSGGTAVDLTTEVHEGYRELAVRATRVMGLRLAGVDIIAEGSLTDPVVDQHWIVELNAAPGLDNYAALGPAQMSRVDTLYGRVLDALCVGHDGSDSG